MTPKRILIVGGGAFGLPTALELVTNGSNPASITVLDRSSEPPSQDAASSDLNKIVRPDYSDPLYVKLAIEAIRKWRSSPIFSPYYHECGVVVISSSSSPRGVQYISESQRLQKELDANETERVAGDDGLQNLIWGQTHQGTGSKLQGMEGYLNHKAGWSNARGAMDSLREAVIKAGVTIVQGESESFVFDEGKKDIKGVRTKDGRVLEADLVVLAAGSWTAALLQQLSEEAGERESVSVDDGMMVATGQVIGTIQLSSHEAERYRPNPVVLNLSSGFYVFPPNTDNILKFAIHGPGYINPNPSRRQISEPRTKIMEGCENDNVPRTAIDELRSGLGEIYPELADRNWEGSRICWYCDTASSDWIIDYHPRFPSLFVASGGSGHAFKFVPILGELVKKGIDRDLPDEFRRAWSAERVEGKVDTSREGGTRILKVEEMAGVEDLGGRVAVV